MRELEEAYNSAAGLYWTSFLLTGCSELSLALTIEILNSEDKAELFSSSQMLAKARRTIVEKAVASIHDELAASASQMASLSFVEACAPPSTWRLDPNTSKHQVESALLAIDVFPRCALLLTIFEGLSLEEASTLLNSNRELLLKGRLRALYDLLKQLVRIQAEIITPHDCSAMSTADHCQGTNHSWEQSEITFA